ncbi:MAG: ABC transporter permease [Desulfurococcaceae archaeon]|nr:ABC transporter permease [Desulfurococcaceae archaeon]
MSFFAYTLKRIAYGTLVVVIIVATNFVIVNLAPGDPAVAMGGELVLSNPEYIKAVRERWGLDKPLIYRLLHYLYNVFLRLDLGYSYRYLEPVSKLIIERLPYTLLLTITSSLLAFALGLLTSVISVRRLGKTDTALTASSLVLWSVPVFYLGIMLVWIFSVNLKLFPAAGLIDVRNPKTGIYYVLDVLHHAFLPVTTLALALYPAYYKLLRDTMVEVLSEDFVMTFRAVGLDEGRLVRRHVLRNALIPAITLLGLQLGYSVAGAALIENVFGWPGVGKLLLDAVYVRDYPVIMGVFLITSITVVAANIVVDLVYAALDPRVRVGR